jgi:hypothetical protein
MLELTAFEYYEYYKSNFKIGLIDEVNYSLGI